MALLLRRVTQLINTYRVCTALGVGLSCLLTPTVVSGFAFPQRIRTRTASTPTVLQRVLLVTATASLLHSSSSYSSSAPYYSAAALAMTSSDNSQVSYIGAKLAQAVDDRLMVTPGFTIDQLMEIAGLSVANAAHEYCKVNSLGNNAESRVLIFVGPGNNGGDGLVAARHLKHFGYSPTVVLPKKGRATIYTNLLQQLADLQVPVLETIESSDYCKFVLIIDALFGFSFKGPAREPFAGIISSLVSTNVPVLSVDAPSGWDIEEGDIHKTGFVPEAVISLTVPKLAMKGYQGTHYVGGRFVPPNIARELGITLPDYGFGPSQVIQLPSESSCKDNKDEVSVMYVTASSPEEGKKIASALVANKLVACVNIIPGVQSVYEWEGKVEESNEVLLMIKTRSSNVAAVSSEVKSLHSYDLPESIALTVSGGSDGYLQWVRDQSKRM